MSLVVAVGVAIPSSIYAYGTEDISYANEVNSLVSVAPIELSTSTLDADTDINVDNTTVSSDIAGVLGIESTDNKELNMVVASGLTGVNNVALLCDGDKEDTEQKYAGLAGVGASDAVDTTIIDVASAAKTKGTTFNPKHKTLLVKDDEVNVYELPNKKSKKVGTLKKDKEVTVTTIEENGYILLVSNNTDKWVKKSSLWTANEKEKAEQKAVELFRASVGAKGTQGDALLNTSSPDEKYEGRKVSVTDADRDILERLVMGEAGNQGFIGAALVAQAIRDTIVYKGYSSVESVRRGCGYSGSLSRTPNQDVLDAVKYIFDEGGYAVKHKVFYFYAHRSIRSSFHESRPFVVEYKGHRFFA